MVQSKFYHYRNSPEEIKSLLNEIVKNFKEILGENLIGVYLHGSLAMGSFNPNSGDIDLLIIIERKLDIQTKRKIINFILKISKFKEVPKKGIELSVILWENLKNFKFPTPFELHYSKMWNEEYEKGNVDYSKQEEDPDLAAHIVVTYNRGICLYGKPIKEVFYPIPEKYYIESILSDLEYIIENIDIDPVYGILNLCRIYYYLKEKVISSKAEAGYWGMENLPKRFKSLINKAIQIYGGKVEEKAWNKYEISQFVEYMLEKIKTEL